MTQTISNFQETVNTLHFGQKAKNVKTTVNINEIVSASSKSDSIAQLEKAQRLICTLQSKIKHYEKMGRTQEAIADNVSASLPESTQYLRDQISFLNA